MWNLKIYVHNRAGCKGAKDGDPSTIGVNIIYGPHVRKPHNEDGDGITTSAEIGSSFRTQRTNAGMRTTGFGVTTNSSRPTNGGVPRGGIPPMAVVRGRGGRAGARGAGRGRVSGSGGVLLGARKCCCWSIRGRGGRVELLEVEELVQLGRNRVCSKLCQNEGGGSRLPSYPVENMTRRSASLMGLTEDQPPAKRGK
ncbi:hypothetical protein MKW92_046563 [Papaver armeniacum]|nr:hypothetical protein MKW92_046563 [Papaver armeniacum]